MCEVSEIVKNYIIFNVVGLPTPSKSPNPLKRWESLEIYRGHSSHAASA